MDGKRNPYVEQWVLSKPAADDVRTWSTRPNVNRAFTHRRTYIPPAVVGWTWSVLQNAGFFLMWLGNHLPVVV